MKPRTSDELSKKASEFARTAVETGEPVPITHYRKPYVRIVPEQLWLRAFAALQREEAAKKAA